MHREELEKIYYTALHKVTAKALVKDNISINEGLLNIAGKVYKLTDYTGLYVFGVGKAALAMAKECETVLEDAISGGFIVSHEEGTLSYAKHFTSTHPIVSDKSITAATTLLEEVSNLKETDLFIFLLSGGASAMIEKPINGLTLDDFTKISSSLLTSGIDIKALNTVRKSISEIKGGKLANAIKAKGEVLVLSDVIGDDLNTIGSAPMYNGKFTHHLIGNNTIALEEAKAYISTKVAVAEVLTTTLDCASEEATTFIKKEIKKYDEAYSSFCLLIGGETTTIVKGKDGYGGRNQELALRLLLEDVVSENISILSAGSDGIDGRSEATGAFVDGEIYNKITTQGLNPTAYLEASDSNTFFKQLGYDFVTGITGTNVMDFIVVLKQ
ncbi:glycerate kinase type-2 family protein [Wenyingzhuangia sp. IMCC45574]